ncbi:MAG: MAPEG family protein [Methylovulum sp.]|uniref:MAPEG family protein n=1 Tax=Methylovulum sp. TaxID=1916980 RepID=UPI002621C0FE|nr:MAPEG family protein [Methylovulum sp.]MDD2724283.1 MAPEG family protein [Methylovulum sp.]MDD5122984.1 MAPEG family protein [Methylovulum sp.]
MTTALSTELYWLTLTTIMTALIWLPYIINRLVEHSPWPALMNPQPDLRPEAKWAERLMRAHDNAVENLVIFAPLVLALQMTGSSTALTATACIVYFFTRLCHLLLYTFGVPLLRTIAFFIGFLCQMVLALSILGVI